MAMSRIGSVPITKQPNIREIYNSFGLMGNEKFLREWMFQEGACGCAGTYHTTLTDTRLLIRFEEANCCCRSSHKDTSVFLRDIAEIRKLAKNCECCSVLCAKCCTRCSHAPNSIEVRGIFGYEIFHVPKEDMEILQIEIPTAIGNHKLVIHY